MTLIPTIMQYDVSKWYERGYFFQDRKTARGGVGVSVYYNRPEPIPDEWVGEAKEMNRIDAWAGALDLCRAHWSQIHATPSLDLLISEWGDDGRRT